GTARLHLSGERPVVALVVPNDLQTCQGNAVPEIDLDVPARIGDRAQNAFAVGARLELHEVIAETATAPPSVRADERALQNLGLESAIVVILRGFLRRRLRLAAVAAVAFERAGGLG